MPKHHFSWPALTPSSWRATAKRFKAHAARGPDGFAREDAVHMPDSHLDQFLSLLHHIEHDDLQWPQQLSFATVIGLAKVDGAHEEGQFRPINLFSTLYRNWARMRTKQMLQQMSHVMPVEALGFIQHRETTEVWLQLQAHIELMLQRGEAFAGLSTDLKRAFNNIGRKQVFMVAQHLGLPWQLLNAWQKFLSTCVRRFDVHGNLGSALLSSSGFPEGCPLSIIAMLVVNWSHHVYMRVYTPQVTTFSFVHNLTLAAREAQLIAQAYFVLREICQLFGLSTDDDKTCVWGLTKTDRQQMAQLHFSLSLRCK